MTVHGRFLSHYLTHYLNQILRLGRIQLAPSRFCSFLVQGIICYYCLTQGNVTMHLLIQKSWEIMIFMIVSHDFW